MVFYLNSRNIIFFLFIINIKISSIFSNEEKCYSIKNCIKCPELDYCIQCKNGFTFNKPKTKCNEKKDIEVKILPPKLILINSTIKKEKANISSIKNKQNPLLNKTRIFSNNTRNNSFLNVSISLLKGFDKKKIKITCIILLIMFVLSIILSLIFFFIKLVKSNDYNEKVALEENVKII